MSRENAVADTAAKAEEARRLLCEIAPLINDLKIILDKRSHVALSLLVGSLEHARALCFVLANDLEASWFSAMILHRSQIDYLVRAAYFAAPASDAQVNAFYRKGQMPKIKPAIGKSRKMRLTEMADKVETHYKWNDKFTKAIHGHWSPLSGMSHGGVELLALYETNGAIGDSTIDYTELVPNIVNVTALGQLALVVAMRMSPLTEAEISGIIGTVYVKTREFLQSCLSAPGSSPSEGPPN